MYNTRESVDNLTSLGENKEEIIPLLEELAELGWVQSHWVKYLGSDNEPFIEIYGDDSYKHIKGTTIKECYEKAILSIKKLKECEHKWTYRKDAFAICNECGQFGRATLEEMKANFDKFHVTDVNGNEHFYSNETLCETCDSKEMIYFSHSAKDEFGSMCPACKTVIEKRLSGGSSAKWGVQAYPIDEDYKLRIPYKEEELSLSIHKIMTIGYENEQSIRSKLEEAYKNYVEAFEKTEKIIDSNNVLTEKEKTEYLKNFVLSRKVRYKKDDIHYTIEDLDINFENERIKSVELELKPATMKAPSETEVIGDVLATLMKNIQKDFSN